MIKKIGNMVYQLRKKVFVTQENLSRGLLCVAELSRIENGEREGDSFLMSALFQRLGKSMDPFEMTISSEEYNLVILRALIQENMESGDYGQARELLEEYEESAGSESLLHIQYIQMVRTILQYLLVRDAADCLAKLRDTIAMTFKDEIRVDWTGYCFCIQEIQLLLLIAYFEMELGETREAILLLEKLHHCIDMTYTAEVSRVRVYPKCCYLLAKGYLVLGEKDKAIESMDKGIRCLQKNCSMMFIEDLLELKRSCEKSEEIEKQLKAFQFAYDLVNYVPTKEFIVRLAFGGVCQEVILNNELLRQMRVAKGKSQDQLSDGICTRETLARIENGRKPNRKYLQELLKKVGVDREKYYSYVVTDDWDVFELIRDYKKNCFMENHEDALEVLEKVVDQLDMSELINKQFVETAKLRHKIRKREIAWDDAMKQLTKALRYTMPEYNGKLCRTPSREEFLILNRMALCLKWSGKYEEAIALYEEILQQYQSSQVKPEHHMHAVMLLYLNYFDLLERCDYLEKAETLGRTGLNLLLKYQRGDAAGLFLANLACVFEKSEDQAKKALVLPCLNASYDLLVLFGHTKKSEAVKQYMNQYCTTED